MTQNPSRFGRFLKFCIGLLIFVALLRLFISPDDINNLLNIDWHKSWHVVLWTLLINVLAALRWHILLTTFSGRSRFIKLLRFILLGRIAGHSLSQIAGDVGSRFVYLKSMDIDMKRGGLTILLDKILEGFLFAAVIIVFLGTIFSWISSDAIYTLILALSMFLSGIWILSRFSRVIGRILKREDFSEGVRAVLSGRTGWIVIVLTLGKYSASAMRFIFILQLCGIDLSLSEGTMGTAVAQMGLIIGITPGGLGLVEAGWAGVLYHFGISSPLVAQFLVLQRLLIFCSVLILSLLYMIFERIYDKWSDVATKKI